MDDDLKSQAIWAVSSVLVLGMVVLGPVSCSVHEDNLVDGLIRDGVDPILANCAISGSATGDAKSIQCYVAAQRGSAK